MFAAKTHSRSSNRPCMLVGITQDSPNTSQSSTRQRVRLPSNFPIVSLNDWSCHATTGSVDRVGPKISAADAGRTEAIRSAVGNITGARTITGVRYENGNDLIELPSLLPERTCHRYARHRAHPMNERHGTVDRALVEISPSNASDVATLRGRHDFHFQYCARSLTISVVLTID